jgi:hypothetical protein
MRCNKAWHVAIAVFLWMINVYEIAMLLMRRAGSVRLVRWGGFVDVRAAEGDAPSAVCRRPDALCAPACVILAPFLWRISCQRADDDAFRSNIFWGIQGTGRLMAGDKRRHLRLVGGNDALVRTSRVSRETHWPPLRVVGRDDVVAVVAPLPAHGPRHVQEKKRAARGRALLAGLVVVMLSSIGQAFAAHW